MYYIIGITQDEKVYIVYRSEDLAFMQKLLEKQDKGILANQWKEVKLLKDL